MAFIYTIIWKDFVRRRSKVANRFMENITNNSILSSNIKFQNTLKYAESSWFGFPVLFPNFSSSKVSSLRKYLYKFKIESRSFLAGDFSLQPVNKKFKHICFNSFPNVKLCHTNSFALPCHQDISIEQVDLICNYLEKFILLNKND